MKDIELLLPRVFEAAAACPEPTAIRHLRDAAIEFCRRTRVWRESDEFELTEDGCEGLAPFQGTQIYEITSGSFVLDADGDEAGIPLDPVTIDWLDRERPGWRFEKGTPRWITQVAPNTVRIAPRATGRLRLELILLPSEDAIELPDVLVDTYARQLADGAIGAILLLPTDFRNPDLGAMHAGRFDQALGRFGARVPRGQQRAPRRVRPSSYF